MADRFEDIDRQAMAFEEADRLAMADAPQQGGAVAGAMKSTGKAIADVLVPPDPNQPMLHQRIPGFLSSLIPKTPKEVGGAAGAIAPSVLSAIPQTRPLGMALNTPVGRTLLAGGGAMAGAGLEGSSPEQAMDVGATTAGINAAAEAVVPAGGKLLRSLPWMKGVISNRMSGRVLDTLYDAVPGLRPAAEAEMAGMPSTLARTSKQPAALQNMALSEQGRTVAGQHVERALNDAVAAHTAATGAAPAFAGPEIQAAYAAMPKLAQDRLIGQVSPGGFTLPQAQAILSWVGSQAFREAPLAQGVGSVPQQMLYKGVRQEIGAGLTPEASQILDQGLNSYGAVMGTLDIGSRGFIGEPNRVMMNQRAWEQYLSDNRAELIQRMGPQRFQQLVEAVSPGAQVGTASRITPGAGTPMTHVGQVARGAGGAPQIAVAPARALLPEIASFHTGRAPFTAPPQIQALMDILMQRGVGEATK